MKQVLLVLLLGTASTAQAQLVNLISTGVRVGTSAAMASRSSAGARDYVERADPRANTTDVNVLPAAYRGQTYPQKRTAPGKLKTPGGEQIAWQEAELQKLQTAMLADSAAALGTPDSWARLKSSQETIARERPTWNVQAYRDEAAFYQAEATRRQRAAPAPGAPAPAAPAIAAPAAAPFSAPIIAPTTAPAPMPATAPAATH